MRTINVVNKERLKGLYGKLIIRLYEIELNHNFIPWVNVRQKLGRSFSINKSEIMELMFFLNDLGFVEISCRGIKICYTIK